MKSVRSCGDLTTSFAFAGSASISASSSAFCGTVSVVATLPPSGCRRAGRRVGLDQVGDERRPVVCVVTGEVGGECRPLVVGLGLLDRLGGEVVGGCGGLGGVVVGALGVVEVRLKMPPHGVVLRGGD